jgi:biopolymer transport protein TolR
MAQIMSRSIRGSRQRSRPMSEINVTPMVDVMLVLLIIFMVTAPLLTVGVTVDLPKTKASSIAGDDEPLAVSIDAKGQIFIQDTKVGLAGLVPRLLAITGNNPDIRIFVRGDKMISYGRVMEVMGTVNAAGFKKVALITERMIVPGLKKKNP